MFLYFSLIIITFFTYGFVAYLIKPVNIFLITISFFAIMLGTNELIIYFFSKIIYRNRMYIYINKNKLIIKNLDDIQEEYESNQIESLKFFYLGDYEWRARNPRFQKYKSRQRYKICRNGKILTPDSFDKIYINSKQYLVKIKEFTNKEYFYKLVDWAKSYKIKFELVEEKYYSEFK